MFLYAVFECQQYEGQHLELLAPTLTEALCYAQDRAEDLADLPFIEFQVEVIEVGVPLATQRTLAALARFGLEPDPEPEVEFRGYYRPRV